MNRMEAIYHCIKNADGWVIQQLIKYGNTVFPASLIKCPEDIETGEKLLTMIMGEKVQIIKTEDGYICEVIKNVGENCVRPYET